MPLPQTTPNHTAIPSPNLPRAQITPQIFQKYLKNIINAYLSLGSHGGRVLCVAGDGRLGGGGGAPASLLPGMCNDSGFSFFFRSFFSLGGCCALVVVAGLFCFSCCTLVVELFCSGCSGWVIQLLLLGCCALVVAVGGLWL